MDRSRAGKVSPEILLLLAIVLCASFEAVSYVWSKQQFEQVDTKIGQSEARAGAKVDQIADELNKRYLQLLKLAEDLALQNGRLETMSRNLNSEKDSLTQLQDNVTAQLDQIKKMGGEQSEQVATLQEKFKSDIASKEKTITQLQGEYEMLKHLMDDQSALLVMMREQALVNASTNSASAAGGAVPPADVSKTAPAGSQSPQSFQSGAIVPIPSSEALPVAAQTPPAASTLQPPTPVQIHDADKPASAPALTAPVAP